MYCYIEISHDITFMYYYLRKISHNLIESVFFSQWMNSITQTAEREAPEESDSGSVLYLASNRPTPLEIHVWRWDLTWQQVRVEWPVHRCHGLFSPTRDWEQHSRESVLLLLGWEQECSHIRVWEHPGEFWLVNKLY